MQLNFIKRLTLLLGSGIEDLDRSFQRQILDYIWSQQRSDGGFSGRKGSGEIYYTSFALRALALLGELQNDIRTQKVFQFLDCYLKRILDLRDSKGRILLSGVDLTSFQFSAQLLEWTLDQDIFTRYSLNKKEFLPLIWKQYERPDGGFSSSLKSSCSSVYQSFLFGVSLQLSDQTFSERRYQQLETFLWKQQRKNGGFSDLSVLRNSGTNPTVAALGLLEILADWQLSRRDNLIEQSASHFRKFKQDRPIIESIDTELQTKEIESKEPDATRTLIKSKAIQYLTSQQMPDGGFKAHQQMPFSDLLSSFSAFVGLSMFYGDRIGSVIDMKSLSSFVDSLYSCQNGFRGGIWDSETDVEYVFYGLALKSMLNAF